MSSTEDPGVAGLCCCRRLSEYSSRHVAEELCLVDSELLRKIDPNELQNGAWMKKEKVDGGSGGRKGAERERGGGGGGGERGEGGRGVCGGGGEVGERGD